MKSNLSLKVDFHNSVEINLLLCLSRTSIDTEISEKVKKLLGERIDWVFLVKAALKHGIVSLLHQNLNLIDSELVPKDILYTLRDYSHQVAFSNIVFTQELLKVLSLFKKNNINAITFKGPILATSIYKNIGLRQFGDLDILVKNEDFLNAFNLLILQGYHPAYQWNFLNKDFETAILQSKSEYPLIKGSVTIDLHQNLTVERFLSSSFTFEDLWNCRESISISGHLLYGFGTEDLLLYLCIHGSKDGWRILKWTCDIAEFVRSHPEINWHQSFKKARSLGCERRLLIGLQLAHTLLDLELNSSIHQKIQKDLMVKKLSDKFLKNLFSEEEKLGRKYTLEKFVLNFEMVERSQDKLGCFLDVYRPVFEFILKLVPNIEDKKFFPLPHYLYYLYYIIRPIRLILNIFS